MCSTEPLSPDRAGDAAAGIGAEMRNGVGIASVGGILVSGILTLFVIPILYDLFTRKGVKR